MGYKSLPDGVQYRDREVVLLASAARTGDVSSDDQVNPDGCAVHVTLDVTAAEAPPAPPPAEGDPPPEPTPISYSLVLTIEGRDPASGNYYTLFTGAAVTDTGTATYRLGPSLAVVTGESSSDYLPQTWRVSIAQEDDNIITYSVGAVLLG